MIGKKFFLAALFVSSFITVSAVPARRGIWKTVTLDDGTKVKTMLCGDEHLHYWMSNDGKKYMKNITTGAFCEFDTSSVKSLRSPNLSVRRLTSQAKSESPSPSKNSAYIGTKKGLIILVQFSDKSFASGHNKSLFNRIANERGFVSSDGFKGSVRDYFYDQSYGVFDLTFDVVGPVTLTHPYSYYGANDTSGDDAHPGQMVADACKAIADSVNYADYDWNDDGYVDQVYVLYAGEGEASSNDEDTVWPHEWDLADSDYGSSLSIDGKTINTYACGNEIFNNKIDGIGTICHEFSHCLGLPDLYDTKYGGNYGTGDWDIMCMGSYNGNSFVPAGYTSYERMECGWLKPTVLKEDTAVSALQPLNATGDAYIIYNAANSNEYYLIENRQLSGWDASLPGRGVLIYHVDYNSNIWYNNMVNTSGSGRHQRLTIFHADNDDDSSYWSSKAGSYSKMTESTDPYPYNSNDSLTNSSKPAAKLYNVNTDGSYYMNRSVKNIKQNADNTASFNFSTYSAPVPVVVSTTDTLLHESFDACSGKGGNDNAWSGTIASSVFLPDVSGWKCTKKYGADKCARFNSSSDYDSLVSPSFAVTGNATITISMAPWGTENTDVNIWIGDKLVADPTLTPQQWNKIELQYTGSGSTYLKFIATKRYFIDDVLVIKDASTGIKSISLESQIKTDNRIYTLSGQYVGTDFSVVGKGIYIVNGKKIVKK